MPMGELAMPTPEDVGEKNENSQKEMEETFTKLEELDNKETLTKEDVDWFEGGVVGKAFRLREKMFYVEGAMGDEDEDDSINSSRTNEYELLRRSVAEKVEEWKKNNSE